ncbi:hypothetical protein [Mycolicibacterium tokaiense]|uniref:hypothetical protein n=1 Tax=Mycolicibacterium tokaiense TaxID=39695 RepID=UPI0021F2BDFB|nr:hypothetical protein [Mycolicibacterium tokaiense]
MVGLDRCILFRDGNVVFWCGLAGLPVHLGLGPGLGGRSLIHAGRFVFFRGPAFGR